MDMSYQNTTTVMFCPSLSYSYENTMNMSSLEHYVNNVSNIYQSRSYTLIQYGVTSALPILDCHMELNGKMHVNKY